MPANPVHAEIGGTHHLCILTGQAGDSEREEGSDCADPADRGSDMRDQCESAEAGCHGRREHKPAEAVCHGHRSPISRTSACTPYSVTPEDMWRPGPWLPPLSIMMTNIRSRARRIIPVTITQRGVRGRVLLVAARSGRTLVSSMSG